MRYRILSAALVLSGIGVFLLGLALRRTLEPAVPAPRPSTAVCHAVTEDSAPADCDYRDGGWYPRGDSTHR